VQGRYADARAHLLEGLALSAALGEKILRAYLLEALAWLALRAPSAGDPARAAALFGAADRLREEVGAAKPPQWRAMQAPLLDEVRGVLGEGAFAQAWAAGRALSPEAAQALFEQPPAIRAPGPALTAREREVLRWVAAGLSDAQVAEKLVVSVRTVHAHLQSIYNKLGVSSRTAALRAAADAQLLPEP
jgi:DNA-binding CsgD family transcriptional regulator